MSTVLTRPMIRTRKLSPARKPVRRTIKVNAPGCIAITHGKVTTTYAIVEFPVGDP
jgi:hypothetical protein